MKKVLYLLFALFSFSLAHSAVLDTDRKEEKKIEIKNLTIDYSIDSPLNSRRYASHITRSKHASAYV